MNEIEFAKLNNDNISIFRNFMLLYAQELDRHQNRNTTEELVSKWSESIINLLGEKERFLELCTIDGTPIGFIYGKIDRPHHKGFIKTGSGYIMEFYILPKYRRKGFGTKMYYRLEELLRSCGARQIYLTADPVTGKPFWAYLGFVNKGEVSPENGLEIYEKEIPILFADSIRIIKHPGDDIIRFVADKHGNISDKVFRGLKSIISRAQSCTEYFCAVLYNGKNEIIGYADFVQNSKEHTKWFYTDLWIAPEYRRQGNAKRLIKAGIDYLSEIGAETLLCTVDFDNQPSINTQKALGFNETAPEPFEFFEVDGLLMFEKKLK